MEQAYDLVVIGSGVAGHGVASRVRRAGWRVALADGRPFGGTCPLRGCDPKRALMAGAEAVDRAARQPGLRGELRIDWPALMAFKRRFTDPVSEQRQRRYAELGIDAIRGQARFVAPDAVEAGGRRLRSRHVLIASGAEPVPLAFPGAEHLADSEDFLALEALPRRIALVGGGYIAAELSCLAARAGAEVTVIEQGPRLLTHFDAELVGWLLPRWRELGIELRTQTRVEAVEAGGSGYRLRWSAQGAAGTLEVDRVFHAAGRAPALATLDLAAGQVAVEDGQLKLDDFLASVSNPAVYAAGDAAARGPALTPVAAHDAALVADALVHGSRRKADHGAVPSVAYTLPPIAAVGLDPAQATAQGLHFRCHAGLFGDWYTARRVGESVYGYKVLIEEPGEHILGAHLVGPQADEVINLFALAMRHGIGATALKHSLFAYPTGASDIGYML